MLAVERHKLILNKLSENGVVSVSKLSAEFDVTEETIRRDLEKLEKRECLLRTHGGAVPIDENTYELSLEMRKSINISVKQAIAREAMEHIVSGDTVFLDASTTTFYMAKELKNMKNITVITNSLRVINELMSHADIKVIAVGGHVSANQSLVGNLAESNIENNYFADKMFFSSKGITKDAGILESNEGECAIKQKMLKNSGIKYYLCDKTKIGRIGFVKLSPFETIDYLITDSPLDNDWEMKFAEHNITVLHSK